MDKITLPFVFTYILPAICAVLFILLALAINKIRDNLFLNFPNVKIREVRWGLYQTLLAYAFFTFGAALTVLTLALSRIGGTVTMALAIALFVVTIAMGAYVLWLGIHYYNSKKDNPTILLITKDSIEINATNKIIDDRLIITTDRYNIEIKTKEGSANGKQK